MELSLRANLMATPISTICLLRFLLYAFLLSLKSGFAFEGRESAESHHVQPTHHNVHITSLMPSSACSPSPKGFLSFIFISLSLSHTHNIHVHLSHSYSLIRGYDAINNYMVPTDSLFHYLKHWFIDYSTIWSTDSLWILYKQVPTELH